MPSLPHHRPRATRPLLLVAVAASLALAATAAPLACNDAPGAPSAPGDIVVNATNEDAVAHHAVDAGTSGTDARAYAPQGIGEAGFDGPSLDVAATGRTGYADVQSPQAACSSCTCSDKVGFCLENGVTATVQGAGSGGQCPMAAAGAISIGCNPLPASCAANPTCACILDAVQPPATCYPECTTGNGYFDVFCAHP